MKRVILWCAVVGLVGCQKDKYDISEADLQRHDGHITKSSIKTSTGDEVKVSDVKSVSGPRGGYSVTIDTSKERSETTSK